MNAQPLKSVGVQDVARHCGVSPSTVCRALNDKTDINPKTRQTVLEACAELGYTRNRVASNLRLKRTDTIACILPAATNEMSVEKMFFLKEAVKTRGYRFSEATFDTAEEADELLLAAIGDRPAGIILGFVPSDRLTNALKKNAITTVCYDCRDERFDCLELDRIGGVKASVEAMIAKGRKAIVLLGSQTADARGTGYQSALEQAGIPINSDLIISERFGRNLFEYGYKQARIFADTLEFDAVQCVNDACAIGVIKALGEKGIKVPGDVSVVGFDDIMVSQYHIPALSTVAQPKEEMANKTVELLFNRMTNPGEPQTVLLETEFIDRESV